MNSNKTLQTQLLKVDSIKVNELNVELDGVTQSESINILTQSIATIGLMQPLVVYKEGKEYVLVAGHKRLAAVKALSWTEVPCVQISKPKDEDREQILMFYANQYRNTPEELEKMVEIAERTWNNMKKDLKNAYIQRYKTAFEKKFEKDPNYITNKREFMNGYFSAKCDFIREVTGLTKSNRTVTRILTSIRDKELGKDKNIDSEDIEELATESKTKQKSPKFVTEKDILKEMEKLQGLIQVYCELEDRNKAIINSLADVETSMNEAKDTISECLQKKRG